MIPSFFVQGGSPNKVTERKSHLGLLGEQIREDSIQPER